MRASDEFNRRAANIATMRAEREEHGKKILAERQHKAQLQRELDDKIRENISLSARVSNAKQTVTSTQKKANKKDTPRMQELERLKRTDHYAYDDMRNEMIENGEI